MILFVGLFVAFCTGVAKTVRCSVKTTGVIVGHEQSYHGSAKYYPVIKNPKPPGLPCLEL